MDYKLYKDNKLLNSFDNESDLFQYILDVQPFSIDYAIKNKGYKIEIKFPDGALPYGCNGVFQYKVGVIETLASADV